MSERIVVVGSGAREHALAFRLMRNEDGQIEKSRQVMVVEGNAGIAREFECIKPDGEGMIGVVNTLSRLKPDLVIIGPEAWLEAGIVDVLHEKNIAAFGPQKNAARIESSKAFMKKICQKAQVSTANYQQFCEAAPALAWLRQQNEAPHVIKIDGLCQGKGVYIAHDKDDAKNHIEFLFNKGFAQLGLKSHDLIVENYLTGYEVSVFGVTDGHDVALFNPLRDYKRLKDGNEGPNTGGMGAVAFLGSDQEERNQFLQRVKEEIFLPVLRQMSHENQPFKGLLYAGLMVNQDAINVLEFNARFGDPETQALMMALKCDIYPLLAQIAHGDRPDFSVWQSKLSNAESAVAVVLASAGYPSKSLDINEITLPTFVSENTRIFFASTQINDQGALCAASGRVMSVVQRAHSVSEAQENVYYTVDQIDFVGKQYRRDIGQNLNALV